MNLQRFYNRHQSRQGARLVVGTLFVASAVSYFSWRLTVFNQEALVFSTAFFAAEFYGVMVTLMMFFLSWRVRVREPEPPAPGLKVDVFIPTYNEPSDLIRLTAMAAKEIRYPHGTWILDDGNRREIRELARALGCRYLARERNTHAKAGNLNNALKYSKANFIAILDADHVPEENFLERLLGYFNDPTVAFVQSPHDYYNIDSFQFRNNPKRRLLWHDQTLFYQIGQAGRDYWNAATFCGTSSVLRRSALDAVGGFATETVTEDMHTAVRLQKRGYASVFHPEPLAFGVAATDYTEYLQQRLRWGHGNVQTLREEGLPFCRGLTVPQRICYTNLGLNYFEGWTRLILYFTPSIVLMTGVSPIGDTRLFFWFFIPYFLFSILCIEELGRGNVRLLVSEHMAMARFPVSILATLGLFRNRTRWRITSKERKAGQVPPYLVLPQLLVLIINVAALAAGVISPPEKLILTMSGGTIAVICVWAAVNAFLAWSVISAVVRDSQNKGMEFSFQIPLPIRYSIGDRAPCCTTSTEISADGIAFTAAFESAPKSGTVLDCEIFIPGRSLETKVEVESAVASGHGPEAPLFDISGRIVWPSANARDLLNRSLHACGWYRRLWWDGDHFRTPLAWIADLLHARSRNDRRRTGGWTPVLFRGPREDEAEVHFGLIREEPAPGAGAAFIPFKEMRDGESIMALTLGDSIRPEVRMRVRDGGSAADAAHLGAKGLHGTEFPSLREAVPFQIIQVSIEPVE